MAYCDLCRRHFKSNSALEQHERDSPKHNTSDSESEEEGSVCPVYGCYESFYDDDDLDEHCQEEHLYCIDCDRFFRSEQNMVTHNKSSIHQDRTIVCPGRKCSKSFISGAGLLHHLESGTCRSRMTRDAVNRLAVQIDKSNIVTNPARLLGGPGAYALPGRSVTSWATSLSFNGSKYECFLCHKEFQTLDRLNQHLQSPAHDDEIYRCPRGWQGCGKEFRTLSALCQHVESEKCGIRRFNDPMQKVVGSMASALKGLIL